MDDDDDAQGQPFESTNLKRQWGAPYYVSKQPKHWKILKA